MNFVQSNDVIDRNRLFANCRNIGLHLSLIHIYNVLTRIIAAPGLWFQRLTVKEPTDKMMEAAIAAMKAVIPENGEDIIR